MTPSEIRRQTLSQLRQAFLKMCSAEWDLALIGQPQEVKTEAALEFARVQRVRLRLGNAVLADIRDMLRDNEDGLRKGRERLAVELEKLNRVKRVLGAVTALLNIVGRIIPLA